MLAWLVAVGRGCRSPTEQVEAVRGLAAYICIQRHKTQETSSLGSCIKKTQRLHGGCYRRLAGSKTGCVTPYALSYMAVLAAGAAALGGRDDSILQHLIMKIGDVMDSMSSCGLIFAVFRPCRLAYGAYSACNPYSAYGGLPNTEYNNIDNDNGITTTAAFDTARAKEEPCSSLNTLQP